MLHLSEIVQPLIIPVVVAVTLYAVYTDCRFRVIKNHLTFPAIAAGLVLQSLGSGWHGLYAALLGTVLGGGLMLVPFLFGRMGAGDVKLVAALGSLLGPVAILNVFLYTTLVGGVLALGYALYHQEVLRTLKRVVTLSLGMFGRRRSDEEIKPDIGVTMPYGLAIAIGTWVFLGAGRIV